MALGKVNGSHSAKNPVTRYRFRATIRNRVSRWISRWVTARSLYKHSDLYSWGVPRSFAIVWAFADRTIYVERVTHRAHIRDVRSTRTCLLRSSRERNGREITAGSRNSLLHAVASRRVAAAIINPSVDARWILIIRKLYLPADRDWNANELRSSHESTHRDSTVSRFRMWLTSRLISRYHFRADINYVHLSPMDRYWFEKREETWRSRDF